MLVWLHAIDEVLGSLALTELTFYERDKESTNQIQVSEFPTEKQGTGNKATHSQGYR